jgi:hypothetical protein
MAIATELWDAGIKAEFTWKVKPKVIWLLSLFLASTTNTLLVRQTV